MADTFQAFLAILGPERRLVAEIWAVLGISRRELTAFIVANRDDLAYAGVQLHVATKDAAHGRLSRFIEIDRVRYAAISRPAPHSGTVRYIVSYLDTMNATHAELVAIRDVVQAMVDRAAPAAPAPLAAPDGPHITYRQEKVGKNGPYWYGYWREDGKLRKKYIGKERPGKERPGKDRPQ